MSRTDKIKKELFDKWLWKKGNLTSKIIPEFVFFQHVTAFMQSHNFSEEDIINTIKDDKDFQIPENELSIFAKIILTVLENKRKLYIPIPGENDQFQRDLRIIFTTPIYSLSDLLIHRLFLSEIVNQRQLAECPPIRLLLTYRDFLSLAALIFAAIYITTLKTTPIPTDRLSITIPCLFLVLQFLLGVTYIGMNAFPGMQTASMLWNRSEKLQLRQSLLDFSQKYNAPEEINDSASTLEMPLFDAR